MHSTNTCPTEKQVSIFYPFFLNQDQVFAACTLKKNEAEKMESYLEDPAL